MKNSGQGLGLLLGSTVIDRKSLVRTTVKLTGAITTLYSFLLALGQAPPVSLPSTIQCGVTPAEVTRIQAAMFGHNESCSYDNVTLGSVLGS